VAKVAVGQDWEVGTTLRYGTGRPYTSIVGATPDSAGRQLPVYGAIDGNRVPDYFRADGRITRLAVWRGRPVAAYLEMLNVLDRRNITGYSYDEGYRTAEPQLSFFSHRTFVLGVDVTL
jgi:hypothetical protein